MTTSISATTRNRTNVRDFLPPATVDRFTAGPLHQVLRRLARIAPALAGRLAAFLFFVAPPRRPVNKQLVGSGAMPVAIPTRVGTLRAWSWGRTGPIALLVHGWAGAPSQLTGFVVPLRRAGWRVVALDMPAHGKSPGRRSSIPRWADALVDVERHLGSEHGVSVDAVIAHSLGAAATNLALTRGLDCKRVVLVSPAVEPREYFEAWVGGVVGLGARFEQIVRKTEVWLGVSFGDLSGARLAEKHAVSALVVHDRSDRETPFAGAEAIVGSWSGAELVATEGLGHVRLLRDDAVIARVVDFLGAGSGRTACATGSCPRLARAGGLCSTCALERELVNPETRRVRAA